MLDDLFEKLINLFKGQDSPRYWYLPASPTNLDIARNKLINILAELSELKEITNLPILYWALLDKELGMQNEISKTIQKVFEKYPLGRYTYLDSLCRERTSLEWSFDWKKINPDDILPKELNADEIISVLGFLSFHPNGFLREKAIKSLTQKNSTSAIPFLLIRVNDWVHQVRKAALSAFEKLIRNSEAKYLASSIPLIKRLEYCGRASHSEFIKKAFKRLSKDKDVLLFGMNSSDNETRRYCFKVAVDSQQFDNQELLNITKREKNGHVRSFCLKQLEQLLSIDEIKIFIPEFFYDKYARVRISALDLYCNHFLEEAEQLLKVQLLSDFRSARETARFYLKKLGMSEMHDFYVNALNNETIGTISGLSEIGVKEDYKLILPFLESKRVKIVRASIRAISKLAEADGSNFLLKYLSDERRGVSKEVSKHFSIFKPNNNNEIEEMFGNTEFQHVKENTMRILCSLSPWDSLPYILESSTSSNVGIKNVGTGALIKWLARITHVYTKPTDAQKIRIEMAIENKKTKLDENLIRNIEFNLKA